MLLDRKRIRRWAKWVALGLAIVFGLSFLFMGVGYGGAGFDLSALFRGGGDTDTTQPLSNQEKLDGYLQVLQANPEDTTTMLAIATLYEDLYRAGEGEGTEHLVRAAAFMENAIDVDPTLKDVYLRLANLYMSQEFNNNQAAIAVLNKAASVDPANPEVFLKLGIAQQSLGDKSAAVLAWQKYLELDPDGDMAEVVREQLEVLTATTTTTISTTTTATDATTTTTSAATTTTDTE
ncbi:MAG: tetratricopeptide repeat protein [Actinobacteria bacterium]|nr:tetratricopeptide repeat protein [Actinomycetota bacterium]